MLKELLSNYTLICGVLAWTICQMTKIITNGIKTHQWNFRKWWESGGMPSSHTATVVAVTTAAGIREGFSSALFAVSFCFACVVMYDAAGVRRQTGKQGKIINEILRWPEAMTEDQTSGDLKERVGHSPLEVMAGAAAGIVIAVILHFIV